MKTVRLDDPYADELLWIVRDPKVVMSQGLRDQVFSQLYVPPVVVVPPGGSVPASIPPFGKVIVLPWEWGKLPPAIDTMYDPRGPMTPHGLIVVPFVPQPTRLSGGVSIAAYDGTMQGCVRACSISTHPGDFSQPLPWTRYGHDTGIQFGVGTADRGLPVLTAGTQYYLNVASMNERGEWTAPDAGDIRMRISPPYSL